MVSFLAATGNAALAEEATSQGSSAAPPTNEQLIEKLDRMEARIRLLENELHRKGEADAKLGSKARMAKTHGNAAKGPVDAVEASAPDQSAVPGPTPPGKKAPAAAWNMAPAPGYMGAKETAALETPTPANEDLLGVAPSPLPGLKIGAYGELRFGGQQNPDANGQWQTGFDAARLVLLPTISSMTISSSIPRSNSSTRARDSMPTISCMGRPRSSRPMSISESRLLQYPRAWYRSCPNRLAQFVSRADEFLQCHAAGTR
jgi:hypothetical protein